MVKSSIKTKHSINDFSTSKKSNKIYKNKIYGFICQKVRFYVSNYKRKTKHRARILLYKNHGIKKDA